MTLIRKHERVDGKFDVEPDQYTYVLASYMDNWVWGCKKNGILHVSQLAIPWSSVTAYIDPSEEVAPVEVRNESRGIEVLGGLVRFPEGGEGRFQVVTFKSCAEQVANLLNLKVKEDREIGRGTFITYCDNCGQEHMVGSKCRDGGSHSCSEVYQ